MPFADIDGGRLHYEVHGEGEPLVLIAGTSFDVTFWEPMLPALRGFRVLRLDNRGAGLSDLPTRRITIPRMAEDVAAVMHEAGIPAAHVYGASMGSLVAQQLALAHPERVLSLVLAATSTGATMIPSPRLIPFLVSPFTHDPEVVFRSVSKLLSHSVEANGEDYPGHGLAQRNTSVLRQQLRAQLTYTSMHKLHRIRKPTLVLHGAEDRLIPPANAKLVARLIPGARLELVPGAGHLFHRDRPRHADRAVFDFLLDAAVEILDAQEQGSTPASGRTRQRREQATVLFTDIVDSTSHVVRVGDDEWARLLAHHDKLTQDLVVDYGGRLVTSTGDGVLAVFQEPMQGIRCARHIIEQVRAIGLEVRSGLHAGECTISGSNISGLTVHVAARVAASAGAGEVRVSEALRHLVPLEVAEVRDCGVHVLKGLPGEWPLFAV